MTFARRRSDTKVPSERSSSFKSQRRPRTPSMPRADRRIQLLAVARDIIHDEGVAALTMSALSERSGASKPVVYEHFENSESVVIALLEEYYAKAHAYMTTRLMPAKTIGEYLNTAIDALFEFYSAEHLNVRKITNGFSSSSVVNDVYLRQMEEARELYRRMFRQQGVPKDIAHIAAFAILEIIGSVVFEFSMTKKKAMAREALKQMVGGAVGALLRDRAPRPFVSPN
jgi:AcrR family transcriptional regulator